MQQSKRSIGEILIYTKVNEKLINSDGKRSRTRILPNRHMPSSLHFLRRVEAIEKDLNGPPIAPLVGVVFDIVQAMPLDTASHERINF